MGQRLFIKIDKGRERYKDRVSKGLCGKCGKNKISKDSISICDDCLKKGRL